ncbi:MAG: hypothetical protein KAJ19_10520 [Gammaproteobacteria bacterium]|nr:hypothetical protein [Gammaproteobacteria bacterium]
MSRNKLMGYEEVDVDGKIHIFKADFSFLVDVKHDSGIDPISIYNRFESGEGDAELVLSVLTCSLVSISGVDVIPEDREKICKDLITLKGLQESVILCRYMMSYAMIGDKKKSQILNMEKTQLLIDKLQPSPLKNLKNHLLLWAYVTLISGICACFSIKLLAPLIVSRMG